MEPDHAVRRAAMDRLEVFIGDWAMQASLAAPAGVAGRAVFDGYWTGSS